MVCPDYFGVRNTLRIKIIRKIMFNKLKIRNKLFLVVFVLAFVSLFVGLSGYLGLKKTIAQESDLVNNQVTGVAYLQSIKGALTQVAIGERRATDS